MARAQHAGIKQVPPLQHDEDGEEDGQLSIVHAALMLEVPQQNSGKSEKQTANDKYAANHGTGDNEGVAGTWLLLHDLA